MEIISELLESPNLLSVTSLLIVFVFIVFIPGMIALFRNPKRSKVIFFSCIPASLSYIAWFGLLMWAISGKEFALQKKTK